jgi:hypothetical protein
MVRLVQANLQHSRATTANLSKRFLVEGIYIALIQEPWVVKGKIMGLGETGGKLIYCKSTQTPRTCILLRKKPYSFTNP